MRECHRCQLIVRYQSNYVISIYTSGQDLTHTKTDKVSNNGDTLSFDTYITCNLVSAWLLFNANSAIFQLEQVNFQWDDDEIRFVLDQHAALDFHSASSLKQQSTDRHVVPLGYIILIPSLCCFSLMLRA
jgi:hypothetical protein